MLQPTGSVYLDVPRASRRDADRRRQCARSVAGGLLLAIGLAALTVAALLGAFRVLIHDVDTVMGAIDDSLDDPRVRAELETEIATAITDTMFGDELIAALASFGIDVDREADAIAPLVLDDPAFRAALRDLIVTTHTRVLLEPTDQPLDMTEISGAVRSLIATEIPDAEAVLPPETALYEISADQIPDFTTPVELLDRVALAIAAGALLIPLALLVHPQHHRITAWIGRWLLLVGLIAGVLAIGLPHLGGAFTGMLVVEVTLRALATRLLAPAAIAGIVGIGLVSAAAILTKRERSAVLDEGAAAALGFDEDFFAVPSSRRPERSDRDLVDAGHPLTNI